MPYRNTSSFDQVMGFNVPYRSPSSFDQVMGFKRCKEGHFSKPLQN